MTGTGPPTPLPWPSRPVAEDPFADVADDRMGVFVPAIMSVGLLFSLVTLARDAMVWTRSKARRRRTAIEAAAVLDRLLADQPRRPRSLGVLSRPSYLIAALVLAGGAAYIAIGSTANFLRDGGYVRDIGWLLALSLALAVALGFLAGVALAVFWSWPEPPPWTLGSLRLVPLTVTPDQPDEERRWGFGAAALLAGLATAITSLMVGSGRSIVAQIDEPVARWVGELAWVGRLAPIDPFGRTVLSIVFVVVVGLSALRCRVMALVFPAAFVSSWAATAALRLVIARPRPLAGGDLASFPSGHLVQATLLAGLVPLALGVLSGDHRLVVLSRAVLVAGVAATGLHRIHQQHHWPLDVIAGTALGLTAALMARWVLEHHAWHRSCGSCPWSGRVHPIPWRQGLFAVPPELARRLGIAGAVGAIVAAIVLALLTLWIGLPADPEGYGFGSQISGPVQVGLAVLMGSAGLLALLRWRPTAMALMAVAATGLGIFAAVEYRPALAVALTAALLVPAVVTWVAWQPTETVASLAVLAIVTASAMSATAIGSTTVYDHYFGPTHPESVAAPVEGGVADWLWLGDVDPTSATVVAGGLAPGAALDLWYRSGDDPAPTDARVRATDARVRATAGDDGVARFELTGLAPSSTVVYAVEMAGDEPTGRVDGRFRAPTAGPHDLVIAAASCARSGSNGAVFDAIVAEDPDLFLALGDLHYANLESTDPQDHIDQWGRSLRQPGQAALFSSVPTAYVWDDHDYGPNDADASSPSREAALRAYRRAVPHHGVDPDPDASIGQAFTVGRVRVVMTDTRSQRTEATMLGPDQLGWLIDELVTSSQTHAVVVWANPTPWVSATGIDDWGAHPDERRQIADALAGAGVRNLVMVSGDAHMVAIDDGTNTDYATDGGGGFPLLHAAALDRPGSVKGGPYSHGTFPGPGRYGVIEIGDDGGPTVTVRLAGRTWDGEELVAHSFELQAGADAPLVRG